MTLEQREGSDDHRRWMVYDPLTKEALVTLPYEIDRKKWSGVPSKDIPKSQPVIVWSSDFSKAALYPTYCANTLKHTFALTGKVVELIMVNK